MAVEAEPCCQAAPAPGLHQLHILGLWVMQLLLILQLPHDLVPAPDAPLLSLRPQLEEQVPAHQLAGRGQKARQMQAAAMTRVRRDSRQL